jgi:hypothetical protein
LVFYPGLPPAYEVNAFNTGIPLFISIGENIFRYITFTIPLFVRINISTRKGKLGLRILLAGMLIYFASWLMQIYAPDSIWSQSVFGFAAPAYTIFVWIIGLGLMLDSYYFKLPYKKWHYLAPALLMFIFHSMHAVYVYNRL